MFKSLYKKCLDLAGHKSSKYYLAIVSFVESSFFPIPPDVMVVPMVISKKTDFKKIRIYDSFFASTMGTTITSGGIGKKELSTKDTIPRYKFDLLFDANSIDLL